jgi:peptidyl-prolyl cis-trans isomerase SurA
MNKTLFFLTLYSLILFGNFIQAQPKTVVDEIVAVVGDQIILRSDIEKQLSEYTFPDSIARSAAKCQVFKSTLYQKMLLNQALLDSLQVTDDQVNNEVDRRMEYFISQIGSKEKLESYYNKTVAEIKLDMFEPIKEMILIDQMKEKVIGKSNVSPSEVEDFFKNIPTDSLPYYNTEVEIAQILIFPKATVEEDLKAKEKLENIRQRILKGDKFENMAILYSQDDGSATKGGDLGLRGKIEFVPEFAAVAFRLKKDSVSAIVKTKFGYHIIKVVERKGDKVRAKHILIKPAITNDARLKTIEKLNDIRKKILKDSMTFEQAAFEYSEDEETKNSGGLIVDQNTSSSKITMDKLEASLFFIIDTMQVGHITPPVKVMFPDGRSGYRLVYLKSKTKPHKANLKDDYAKIKDLATSSKELEVLEKWVNNNKKKTYITIYPPYIDCEGMKDFTTKK